MLNGWSLCSNICWNYCESRQKLVGSRSVGFWLNYLNSHVSFGITLTVSKVFLIRSSRFEFSFSHMPRLWYPYRFFVFEEVYNCLPQSDGFWSSRFFKVHEIYKSVLMIFFEWVLVMCGVVWIADNYDLFRYYCSFHQKPTAGVRDYGTTTGEKIFPSYCLDSNCLNCLCIKSQLLNR